MCYTRNNIIKYWSFDRVSRLFMTDYEFEYALIKRDACVF